MRCHFSKLLISLFLIVATTCVFLPVRNCEFVFDDDPYVTQNQYVQAGVTWESVRWAFTDTHIGFWHPLTWLSLMCDYELYGLNPGGYHWTNLLLHIENMLLLFLVLTRMTGALWRSAFVAALFALHPLHVESVAWVAARKDVLSTLFWMLSMLAYFHYVKDPRIVRYLLIILFFVLGLMTKPMLVTLPFVLLLLDYWPLGRFSFRQLPRDTDLRVRKTMNSPPTISAIPRLILEKVPLFTLTVICSVSAICAEKHAGALGNLELLPFKIRIANALVSYTSYIRKMIWPSDLACFYPHPWHSLPLWQTAGAGFLLLCISVLVIRATRRFPYLAIGWLWYLGTLVPVIGLVQVGSHAMADRYTYVPLIGLFIIIAWGLADLAATWRYRRVVLAMSAVILVLAFAVCASFQVRHWQNSVTLFEHTLDVTAGNYLAHYNLGASLAERGRLDEAIGHYAKALRIKPDLHEAHNNWGVGLWRQGRIKEAISHYAEALRIKPNDAMAHNNLGIALARQGKPAEAVAHFRQALRINPDYMLARKNLEVVLTGQRESQ